MPSALPIQRKIPPLLGLALRYLLLAHGWSARELAETAGLAGTTITEYMSRPGMLSRERLEWLAQLMELDATDVEAAVLAAMLMHPEPPPASSPVDPTPEARRIMMRAAAHAALDVADHVQGVLLAEARQKKAALDLEEGRRLWRQLKPFAGADLLELAGAPIYDDQWGLAVVLCQESEKAAADQPPRALELAEAAVRVARRVPGTFGIRLQGSCTGFLGNAQRVGCDLFAADASFAEAWRLWWEGDDVAGLLSEAWLLDMEASLRRDQRRFAGAIALHDQAIAAARPDERGHFLLNKSVVLGEMGDLSGAAEVLDQAAQEIDSERHPRLRCVLLFNRAALLCRLDRAGEAVGLVDEVRGLVEELRNDFDLVKTTWLQANVDAGLGRRQQALAGLQQVRRDFEARKSPLDHALVSLDLVLLLRRDGLFPEIEVVAAEMVTIFKALRVGREALSAVLLFQEAVRNRSVTEDMIRRLQDDLSKWKARPGPGLRADS